MKEPQAMKTQPIRARSHFQASRSVSKEWTDFQLGDIYYIYISIYNKSLINKTIRIHKALVDPWILVRQLSTVYLAFRMALQLYLESENLYEVVEHRHDVFWTLQGEADAVGFFQHAFTVYIPEHPYKNYFNDLYAMRLPIFTPSIHFLARFWPEVQSLDSAGTYDGWFDRTLPRTRLMLSGTEAEVPELLEPFDLSSDGYNKARLWLEPADYFHFPGLMHFNSIADLHRKVATEALEASLLEARRVMADFARQRRAESLQYFASAMYGKTGGWADQESFDMRFVQICRIQGRLVGLGAHALPTDCSAPIFSDSRRQQITLSTPPTISLLDTIETVIFHKSFCFGNCACRSLNDADRS